MQNQTLLFISPPPTHTHKNPFVNQTTHLSLCSTKNFRPQWGFSQQDAIAPEFFSSGQSGYVTLISKHAQHGASCSRWLLSIIGLIQMVVIHKQLLLKWEFCPTQVFCQIDDFVQQMASGQLGAFAQHVFFTRGGFSLSWVCVQIGLMLNMGLCPKRTCPMKVFDQLLDQEPCFVEHLAFVQHGSLSNMQPMSIMSLCPNGTYVQPDVL